MSSSYILILYASKLRIQMVDEFISQSEIPAVKIQ